MFLNRTETARILVPLLNYLSGNRNPANGSQRYHLLSDGETAAELEPLLKSAIPLYTEPGQCRAINSGEDIIIVVSATAEPTLLETLGQTAPAAIQLGYLRDILPWAQTQSNMMNQLPMSAWDLQRVLRARDMIDSERAAESYCIVCTPRSGSHYLCDLLSSAGIGQPKEHAKRQMIYLARNAGEAGFSFADWHRTMRGHAAADGFFGSKIVSHDFVRICKNYPGYLDLFDHIIHLYRRDKVEQALSLYRARFHDVWHIRTRRSRLQQAVAPLASLVRRFAPGAAAAENPGHSIDYHYKRLASQYRMLINNEARIEAVIRRSKRPVLPISYEEIAGEPRVAVQRIAEYVNGSIRNRPVSQEQVIRKKEDAEVIARFMDDAAADGLELTRDYRPETVEE